MAVTAEQIIKVKGLTDSRALPVASGELMVQGTVAVVSTATGLLEATDATIIAAGVDLAVIVKDGSANATGPAATTAAGSISGSFEEASAVAGDKTVRECYISGAFVVPLTGADQASVGKKLYVADNYTFSLTSTSNQIVGVISQWLGGTKVVLELNKTILA